ncbi:MAG: glycosyltransferase [Bacteroidia bacterium]
MLHEWYHYWSVSVPVKPPLDRAYTVDILTTACPGEPRDMIVRTLHAMVAIKYPHTNYLCDEGNDPELKKICQELGVIHVTRVEKINAKAGNINNALNQAKGEICVVLDPDHEPIPEFLDRTLPYFQDSTIGFVQCVQAYGNQSESIIARGAAEQTYHFYGPMMMCMNTYGTVQAIGANCTFRRSALDSIGGHAAGLSEDMHTAMQLHAKGWKSIYIPELLTRGLVPATLSAYYKQQLKWSRGTFELLFRTYPSLYKKLTTRQKIHYFTIPLYFLFGLVNLIDILIPALALSIAEVPWEVNLMNFGAFFLPLCTLSMLIRMYAQRWLLEKHERGFHLAGGILRTATWWIFLIGFVYTIFKIKVPYIPTPKEDEHQNYWKLSIPNAIFFFISLVAMLYGLSIDWSPYSFAMASYGIINAGMLAVIVVMSQQQILDLAKQKVKRLPFVNALMLLLENIAVRTEHIMYGLVKIGPVALLLAISLLFFSYSNLDDDAERSISIKPKETGGFYSGLALAGNGQTFKTISLFEKLVDHKVHAVSIVQKWDSSSAFSFKNNFPASGVIPVIMWEPETKDSSSIYAMVKEGKFDTYLKDCAAQLREYRQPVFLSFAPGFDDPQNSWCIKGEGSDQLFIKAWQYIYTFFNNLGISNITWVWQPSYAGSMHCYPGPKFVDWIGVNVLNYGNNLKDKGWYSFSDLYEPFRKSYGKFQKPVMICELGTAAGPYQSQWLEGTFKDIASKYKEIKSILFFSREKKFSMVQNEKQYFSTVDFSLNGQVLSQIVKNNLNSETFNDAPFLKYDPAFFASENKKYKSTVINGSPGNFNLMIHGAPYYMRGVAYNTAHDWRDGNMPLTRRQVIKDFDKIKAMGANTIRRYDYGIYDRNVLNIAAEKDLRVLYGFWFDPKVDYYKDTLKVKEYIKEIEETVLKFKNHPSILAWSLGNETWGLLKHRYNKPYLTKVRDHYVKLIETLAQRIHQLDPGRPVFSCMEHEEYQLPGELVAFRDGAPSIDAIGVNSYYTAQISKLNHVAWQFDSLRPYFVSEFGPPGYWDPTYNKVKDGLLIEDSEIEKANWYKEQWSSYVYGHKGNNIGGFAYCWHDRMEGSNTWFGLTDFRGRPKPSYYALKELWTNKKESKLPYFSIGAPDITLAENEYVFKAVHSGKIDAGLKYEWYLHKDDYLERIDNVKNIEEGKSAIVTMPSKDANYRLYLYVSDSKGRVTTASVPLKIKQPVP